jgi:hypothetical protein
MAIEITPELQSVVQGIFAGGQYANEGEVLDQLRRDLQQGIAELDSGERLDAPRVFAELRQRAATFDRVGE